MRADTCETPGGVSVAPYYVLEYPDWVHLVALDSERRLVIVRQYRQGIGRVLAELPGGGMEPSDVSPLETARRELLEETGCAANEFIDLGPLAPNPATHNNRVHTFLALNAHPVAAPKLDLTEDIAVDFVTWDEVLALVRSGEFAHALHVASLFLAQNYLASRSLT